MLSSTDRWSAWLELQSLRCCAEKLDEPVKPMIAVSPEIRENLLAFCAEYPSDAPDILHALAVRDYMLHLLETGQCPLDSLL